MKKRKKLTREEITHLADLAGLELSEKEVNKYQEQLAETLTYVENLNEIETKNISPTDNTVNLKNIFFKDGEENRRLLNLKQVFLNVKKKKKEHFTVGRIL